MLNQSKVREGLDRTGRQLITDLQAAMVSSGANATGKTAASLAYTINFSGTGVQFLLTGGAGWAFVEQGRGKTVNKSGTGEVRKAIEEWAQARGIPAKRVPGYFRTAHNDKVQGRVVVSNTQLDDMIILRSDGAPTYNFAVVVDDHDMGVTHIIRGVDHLTNAERSAILEILRATKRDLPSDFGKKSA